MKMKTPRMYHPFSTNRTARHLLVLVGIISIPLIFLFVFSRVAQIDLYTLTENLGISLFRMFIATFISVILGWLCAVLFYRGKASNIALPIFDLLQSLPTSAILPMAVLYFGPSNGVVILFLVLAIIWPIFFSIIGSLKLIRRDWVEAVSMSEIKGLNYLRFFLIPVTLPGLITGLIIGLGEGWEALVATEIIAGTTFGLGHFFNSFSGRPEVTLFGILCVLAIIFALNKSLWLPLLESSHKLMEE